MSSAEIIHPYEGAWQFWVHPLQIASTSPPVVRTCLSWIHGNLLFQPWIGSYDDSPIHMDAISPVVIDEDRIIGRHHVNKRSLLLHIWAVLWLLNHRRSSMHAYHSQVSVPQLHYSSCCHKGRLRDVRTRLPCRHLLGFLEPFQVGQFCGFSAERISQFCSGAFLVLDLAATDMDLCPKERRPFM